MIGLVLSVCISMADGSDDCDSLRYVVETYPRQELTQAIDDCTADMVANQQEQGDRYLSCQFVDPRYMQKRKSESVKDALTRINQE